jgi:hypothetical protein
MTTKWTIDTTQPTNWPHLHHNDRLAIMAEHPALGDQEVKAGKWTRTEEVAVVEEPSPKVTDVAPAEPAQPKSEVATVPGEPLAATPRARSEPQRVVKDPFGSGKP